MGSSSRHISSFFPAGIYNIMFFVLYPILIIHTILYTTTVVYLLFVSTYTTLAIFHHFISREKLKKMLFRSSTEGILFV